MSKSRTFRAPGRVNLIGEHTDYNLGFVLPIALDRATYIETTPSGDDRLHVWSEHHREERSWPAGQTASLKPSRHWSDYVAGVARELALAGVAIKPLRLSIRSDVPEGAGLSSSAALEVSTAFALLQGAAFDRFEIAKLCQRAESEFVGMPCGIMDQFVSVFGRAGAAIRIDCRSLEYQTVELPRNVEIVAVNSMVKHELGASAYRTRVEECAIAVECIRQRFPEVRSLRDATPEHLEKTQMPMLAMRRARHIVSENRRVEFFVTAAARGELHRMGDLFIESHRSMQHDYEITCDEVDFLVDAAAGTHGCYGARMTGGGFGGCTVNLIQPGSFDRFASEIRARYRERFGIDPAIFPCVPAEGASEIGVPESGGDPVSKI
ncbi:MAG: galactokinase [Acidobacteriota bacterium]|nr:galactokinase [Acidobacteriota bacterium]